MGKYYYISSVFISVVEGRLAVDVQARLIICCSCVYPNLMNWLKSLNNETMLTKKRILRKHCFHGQDKRVL